MTHLRSQSAKNTEAQLPTTGFLRLPQILALIPVSKSTWWEGCRAGHFPKPIKLTARTTVWRVEDIRAFIEQVGKRASSQSLSDKHHNGANFE